MCSQFSESRIISSAAKRRSRHRASCWRKDDKNSEAECTTARGVSAGCRPPRTAPPSTGGRIDPTANIYFKFIPNPLKIDQKSMPNPSKIHPKSMENRAPGRFRFQVASSLDFGCLQDGFWRRPGPSWEPSWAKLAAKVEAKSRKNQCKNALKNRYLSRSIFNAMLVGLGRENGGKLATKSNEKWMWTARGEIFKKPCFP